MDVSNQPTEIKLTDQGKVLRLFFEDGSSLALAAEDLRSNSPSVEGKGISSPAAQSIPSVKDVAILDLELVGNYAIRVQFDDRHGSGIYSWDLLRRLGSANGKN
ncbi:gamma-butyrobetaine hydroxylase-like domain-containing protein [Rhodoblastus sp.]|uniref:gamma-butyrobetaine hydroxylase-like domain-containing protein n=1 Tax=Rhodoblastus sp. TaxID=1962975 RepID=UPI003F9708F5